MLLFGDCLGVRGLQGVSRGSPEGPYRPHLCTHLWRTVPPPRGPTPKRNLGLSNYLTPVDLSSGFRAKRSERLAYRNFPIQTVQNRAAHKVTLWRPPDYGRGYLGNVIWELFGKWRARPVTPWNPRTAQLLHSTATATRARSPRQPRSWRQHATNPDFRRFGGFSACGGFWRDIWGKI